MQVDSLLGRLLAVKGRIDSTEELLLLELAHRRNEIVSFTLVRLSSFACKLGLRKAGGGFSLP
jgi:hypothetical protein